MPIPGEWPGIAGDIRGGGQAARGGEPQLDIVVIRSRQHQFLQAAMASMVVEAGSP